MEELRPVFVDRFVLSAVNNRVVSSKDFEKRESGEVRLGDEGRTGFVRRLARAKEGDDHPSLFEGEDPPGLVPHVQALLLARCLRGDLDGYPPFLWK